MRLWGSITPDPSWNKHCSPSLTAALPNEKPAVTRPTLLIWPHYLLKQFVKHHDTLLLKDETTSLEDTNPCRLYSANTVRRVI